MENVLKNFVTIEMFRFERPRLSIMNDEQIQEALNISTSMLDGICNGLISLVVQYSLSKEKKDPNNELYRTDFELEQIKHAVVFQTQYVLNLGNDFTIGSNSASTGGINYSFQRPESRQELAPGVKEFLARARVFELTNIGGSDNQKGNADCSILKQLMNIEDGDRRYLQKYQPNADIGSIATISQGHTIEFVNPNNTNWAVKQAEMIKDKNGDYYYLWSYPNLAFFGDNVDNAISKREAYKAIWNALWWNKNTTYPNEAIVRYFDVDKNLVYTFKSNQDNNLNHDPLKDNKDNFWWKQVNSNDSVDIEAVVNSVLGDKEFLNKINAIKGEFDNTLDAFWNQIKDNEHLLKKFEELYDQTKTENEQLKKELETKINEINKDNIAYKNQRNIFEEAQQFNKGITSPNNDWFINVNGEGKLSSIFLQSGSVNSVGNDNNSLVNKEYVDNKFTRQLLPIGYRNDRNVEIMRLTYSTLDNTSSVHNPNGILLLGGKSGLEITSSVTYKSGVAITKPNQLTTKEYVDNAIRDKVNASIDTTNFAKLNENNTFLVTQNFLNGTLDDVLDNGLSLVNKDYVLGVRREIEKETIARFQQTIWRRYSYTSGDVIANTFVHNFGLGSEFDYTNLLEIIVYTDDGQGNHKYITTRSIIWENEYRIRVNLNDNITPKTPYHLFVRKIGVRN